MIKEILQPRIRNSIHLCVGILLSALFSNAFASSSSEYDSIGTSPALPTPAIPLTDQQMLGKFIFFDTNLSEPAGQSCASCHQPVAGFADPDSNLPVSEGVIPERFGHRNSPSVAYASFSPPFSYDTSTSIAKGGQFWDGRRATLAEQAKDPFLNPVEMNNPNKSAVLMDIQSSSYASLFNTICGSISNVDMAYNCVAESLAAYEESTELNPFTSKFDYVLAGMARFTEQEQQGMALFNGRAMCSQCHTTTNIDLSSSEDMNVGGCVESKHKHKHKHSDDEHNDDKHDDDHKYYHNDKHKDEGRKHHHHAKKHSHSLNNCSNNGMWTPVLFTDFQYYNLGLPRNDAYPFMDPSNPIGGSEPIIVGSGFGLGIEDDNSGSSSTQSSNHNFALSQIDLGLGGVLNKFSENGRFKVPTLRNVELTAPYMHNGVLTSLKEVVSFYNTRNTGAWGLPEVEENVEQTRVGNLGLSAADEDAIVAFMLTLTDGYIVENNDGGYEQCSGHKKDHHKRGSHKKHSKKCKYSDDHEEHSKKCKHDDEEHSKKCKHDDDHEEYSKKCKYDDDHEEYSKKCKHDDDHEKHSKKCKHDDD